MDEREPKRAMAHAQCPADSVRHSYPVPIAGPGPSSGEDGICRGSPGFASPPDTFATALRGGSVGALDGEASTADPTETRLLAQRLMYTRPLNVRLTVTELHDDLLFTIFSFLDPADILRSACVCRRFRDVGMRQEVWFHVCQRKFIRALRLRSPHVDWRAVTLALDGKDPYASIAAPMVLPVDDPAALLCSDFAALADEDRTLDAMAVVAHTVREYGHYRLAETLFQKGVEFALHRYAALAPNDRTLEEDDSNTGAAPSQAHAAHGQGSGVGGRASSVGARPSTGFMSVVSNLLGRVKGTARADGADGDGAAPSASAEDAPSMLTAAAFQGDPQARVEHLRVLAFRSTIRDSSLDFGRVAATNASLLLAILQGWYGRRLADAYYNLSLAKGNQGRLNGRNGSKKLREKAIEMYKRTLGADSEQVAVSVFALADIYYVEKEYDRALPLYQEALRIRQRLFPEESEEMAQTYVGLGLAYDGMGKFDLAEAYYLKALPIRERLHGPWHPKVARVLVNIGALYKSKGELTRTVPLYERALAIREKWLGVRHPYTERVRTNLRRTREQLGLIPAATTTPPSDSSTSRASPAQDASAQPTPPASSSPASPPTADTASHATSPIDASAVSVTSISTASVSIASAARSPGAARADDGGPSVSLITSAVASGPPRAPSGLQRQNSVVAANRPSASDSASSTPRPSKKCVIQ